MAFFGLLKKKKKDKAHKKLKAAPPSPPSTPPQSSPAPAPTPPPRPGPPAGLVEQVSSASSNAMMMGSIREESLYTKAAMDPHRGTTTTTTQHIPSPTNPTNGVVVSPQTTQTMREFEANQAAIDLTRSLVKRFIADIWNRGEVDLIPDVCSPSLRFNGNTGFDRVGHEGLARMVNTIREALDDYHCEIHSMVVENNKAFCRLRFTGK